MVYLKNIELSFFISIINSHGGDLDIKYLLRLATQSKISHYFRDLLDAVRKWEEEEFAGGKVLFTYQITGKNPIFFTPVMTLKSHKVQAFRLEKFRWFLRWLPLFKGMVVFKLYGSLQFLCT